MGSVIVQLAPDDSRFVRWSSVSGGPTHLFKSKKDLRRYLMDDFSPNEIREHPGGRKGFRRDRVDPAVERIIETGCSGRNHLSSHFRFDAADDDLCSIYDFTFHRRSLTPVVEALFSDAVLDSDDEYEASVQALHALAEAGTISHDPYED